MAAAERRSVPLAIASAVLFGASTPLAKLLLGAGVDPWLLAGLLYLGSGWGLAVAGPEQRKSVSHRFDDPEAVDAYTIPAGRRPDGMKAVTGAPTVL